MLLIQISDVREVLFLVKRRANEDGYNALYQESHFEEEMFFPEKKLFIGHDPEKEYQILKSFCEDEDNNILFISSKPYLQENTLIERLLRRNNVRKPQIKYFGLRNHKAEEIEKLSGMIQTSINKLQTHGLQEVTEDLMETLRLGNETLIYLDLAVLDPSITKSEDFGDQGGLTARELVYMVQKLKHLNNLKGIVLTYRDINSHLNREVMAKILLEIL